MFTHYKDIKCEKNTEVGVVWGLGVTQGNRHVTSYSTVIETMRLFCTIFDLLSLISQNLKTPDDYDHAHSRDSL